MSRSVGRWGGRSNTSRRRQLSENRLDLRLRARERSRKIFDWGIGNHEEILKGTLRRRPLRNERQLQVIDDPVHDGMVRDEGDDLHPAALMEPLTLLHEYCKAAAFRTDHGVDLVDLPDQGSASPSSMRLPDQGSASPSSMRLPNQGRPALGGETAEFLLDDSERRRRKARLPDLSPVGVRVQAVVPDSDLPLVRNMGSDPGDKLQKKNPLGLRLRLGPDKAVDIKARVRPGKNALGPLGTADPGSDSQSS